jgi:hypothetical protein
MAADTVKSPLPAWIMLPFLFAATVAVLTTWGTGSVLLGLATAAVGAASAAWWCERTLRAVVGAVAQVARGDCYAALPSRVQLQAYGGAIAESVAAAETMRQALIDADALAVDHKSREAESRLRHANRGFFTQRFRGTIDQLTVAFKRSVSPPPISARATRTFHNGPRMRSMPRLAPAAMSPLWRTRRAA